MQPCDLFVLRVCRAIYVIHLAVDVREWDVQGDAAASVPAPEIDPLVTFTGHTDIVEDVCCSPHSPHTLASCSDDGTIRLWDTRVPPSASTTKSGSPAAAGSSTGGVEVIKAHSAEVNSVAFSPFMESLFLSASADHTAAIWYRSVALALPQWSPVLCSADTRICVVVWVLCCVAVAGIGVI